VVRVRSLSRSRNVRNTVRASAANADPAQATIVHRLRASRRARRHVTG
jgi:hypothetical protein